MYSDALLLEMLSDGDIAFALEATGTVPGPRLHAATAGARHDPPILEALLDDGRLYAAVTADPQVLLKVTPYFHFSVLLRQARRELRTRSFTAEWLAPRHRVPVFDAGQVAGVLEDGARLHYLAELLASFSAVRDGGQDDPSRGPGRARSFCDLSLEDLRRRREQARPVDLFALNRRLGDVALFLAGVFPDSATGEFELASWEMESQLRYRQAARAPIARQCGLREILDALAGELHPARKALNFVADRFLHPLRYNWFLAGA